MLRTSYAIILGSSIVVSACAQSPSSQTASVSPLAVTIHQRLNPSCELVQPAVLRDNGKYASIAMPGTAAEVYSPELAKDDFLVYSAEVPGKLVKLARKSGFRVKSGSDPEGVSPHVVDIDGNSHCPNLEEALRNAGLERIDRRRQVQAKLYHPISDGVTPPTAVSTPQPKSDQQNTGAATTPGNAIPGETKRRVQGTVILELIVGSDGAVPQVKVVRPLTPELDRKAVEVVKSWKFQPARKDGLPVPVLVNVEVNFCLY